MPDAPDHPGVYIEEIPSGARPIAAVETSVTAFVGRSRRGPVDEPTEVDLGGYERVFGGLWTDSTMSYAVEQFFANGGSRALIVRVAEPVGKRGLGRQLDAAIRGSARARTGLHALDNSDSFNVLCIPPPTFETDVSRPTLAAALDLCERRRAFVIVDAPRGWSDVDRATTGMTAGELGAPHPNGAVYFPRVRISDPLDGDRVREFAPCGVIAGLYARTDARRGVWKAPAGIEATLRGVRALSCAMTDEENALLDPLGVNCLRAFDGTGPVAWGARTLEGSDAIASEWSYVPVRRTALFIEESLDRGLQWVVFEPNDEPLWAAIRQNVGAFMHTLFRQGAFQGTSAKEAYLVKCDGETTTRSDIDRGIVNVMVGFAPLKPAEFVVVGIQLLAGRTVA